MPKRIIQKFNEEFEEVIRPLKEYCKLAGVKFPRNLEHIIKEGKGLGEVPVNEYRLLLSEIDKITPSRRKIAKVTKLTPPLFAGTPSKGLSGITLGEIYPILPIIPVIYSGMALVQVIFGVFSDPEAYFRLSALAVQSYEGVGAISGFMPSLPDVVKKERRKKVEFVLGEIEAHQLLQLNHVEYKKQIAAFENACIGYFEGKISKKQVRQARVQKKEKNHITSVPFISLRILRKIPYYRITDYDISTYQKLVALGTDRRTAKEIAEKVPIGEIEQTLMKLRELTGEGYSRIIRENPLLLMNPGRYFSALAVFYKEARRRYGGDIPSSLTPESSPRAFSSAEELSNLLERLNSKEPSGIQVVLAPCLEDYMAKEKASRPHKYKIIERARHRLVADPLAGDPADERTRKAFGYLLENIPIDGTRSLWKLSFSGYKAFRVFYTKKENTIFLLDGFPHKVYDEIMDSANK